MNKGITNNFKITEPYEKRTDEFEREQNEISEIKKKIIRSFKNGINGLRRKLDAAEERPDKVECGEKKSFQKHIGHLPKTFYNKYQNNQCHSLLSLVTM